MNEDELVKVFYSNFLYKELCHEKSLNFTHTSWYLKTVNALMNSKKVTEREVPK